MSVKVSFISGFIFSQAGLSAVLAWLTQKEKKKIRVALPGYPIICIWQDVIAFVNTSALTLILSLTIQKEVLCRTPNTFWSSFSKKLHNSSNCPAFFRELDMGFKCHLPLSHNISYCKEKTEPGLGYIAACWDKVANSTIPTPIKEPRLIKIFWHLRQKNLPSSLIVQYKFNE